jgi:uncharacterized membrane protein YbaN (DUF454 family)
MRHLYIALGAISVALGIVGVFLPLVPTVPFMLLAAFFFAKGHPPFEQKLLAHPRFGPPIRAWREHGAIPLVGKVLAVVGLAGSSAMGFLFLHDHWRFAPLAVAVICAGWILSRPTAQRSSA